MSCQSPSFDSTENTESTHKDYCNHNSEAEVYYKRSEELQTRDGLELIKSLTIAEGSRVLDLGCGTGNLAQVLAEKVGPNGHVTGVDPDKERIKVAKEKNTKANVTFVEADGETFPEEPYDLVFSNYVLHWIEDKEAVFKRVHRNLQPGGKFAFNICYAIPPLSSDLLKAMGAESEKEFMQHLFIVPLHRLEELSTCSAFEVIRREVGTSSLTFTSIDSALEFNFVSTNGLMDPALVSKESLEQLELKYANRPIQFDEEYACLVLLKRDV